MKNLVLLLTALIFGMSGTMAATAEDKVAIRNAYGYNNSFIFVENGITFSVYPDGEFDFYMDNRVNAGVSYRSRNVNITFNSGFDYNPFVQYDDYGAVIQVENVPVYYDFYGRVTQIGSIDIRYRNGRLYRLGGLYAYYNRRGFFTHHTGFINIYNRRYIYRPFHNYFARPALGFCLVYNTPYRRYYNPVRYTYYKPYRFNKRRAYARYGKTYRYNKMNHRRSDIYRNDKRVVARDARYNRNHGVRSNNTVAKRSNVARTDRTIAYNASKRKNDRGAISRSTTTRTINRGNSNGNRNIKRSTAIRKSTAPKRPVVNRTVTKRQVTTTPRSKTVTRSTTTYRKPVGRTTQKRTVSQGRSTPRKKSMASRSVSPRKSKTTSSRSSNSMRKSSGRR